MINNPLQMNDWKIKNFLILIFSIQISLIGLIIMDYIGISIPVLRQLVGFVYLTFIPGMVILRIFRLHHLGNIKTILYASGISISLLMILGFFMNLIYPMINIFKPISIYYLISTLVIVTSILTILSYIRDKNYVDQEYKINNKLFFKPEFWFLSIIPFLSIFGSYLVNFYQNNVIFIVLIILIAVIIFLVILNKISEEYYPYAIFVVAISLLYHSSLISNYIWGWDINTEFYYAQLVINNSIWDSNISNSVNSMLSITILAPIYSIILKLDLTWVLKTIYPIIFSLVPVGLYSIYKKYTAPKIAFLACFFFISFFVFYTEMINLARQEIAELFLVLIMLIILDEELKNIYSSILLVIFGFSMVVSHYGLSYIFSIYLIVFLVILLLKNKKNNSTFDFNKSTITLTFVTLFLTLILGWYIYIGNSNTLMAILTIGNNITSNIFTDFFNPDKLQGLNLIQKQSTSYLHTLAKYLYLATQFLILVGVINLFFKGKNLKFKFEFKLLVYISILILILAITVPFFASSFNTSRLYQITLFFLAPFVIIGGKTILSVLEKSLKKLTNISFSINKTNIIGMILIIYFLFNVGFIYQVANDDPSSISLNSINNFNNLSNNRNNNNSALKTLYGSISYIPESDVFGAKWISKNRNPDYRLYADFISSIHVLRSYGMIEFSPVIKNQTNHNSYLYLSYLNNHFRLIPNGSQEWTSIDKIIPTNTTNQIYSNGENKIWLS